MKPDFAIINERESEGVKYVEVDMNKATFQGKEWKSLGDFGKRKFENMLVLSRPQEKIIISYV